MGTECPASPRSGDDSDDPEAGFFPRDDDDNDTVAPLFRLRRLAFGNGPNGGPSNSANDAAAEASFLPSAALPVYVTIHRIRRLVISAIDDSYTVEELRAPRLSRLVVRPLVNRLYNPGDPAVVYCLLANRVQFLRPRSDELIHQTINESRAALCELVAIRILRRFHEDHQGRPGLLLLANILVSGFDPCDAAPEAVRLRRPQWAVQRRGGHERKLTALELAIVSESKMLIGSPACQRVVDAVYRGVIVYTPLSFVDILPDHYKHHPVSLYEPRRAAILNHRRLIVPQIRNLIELLHFVILLVLYILTVAHYGYGNHNAGSVTIYEAAFDIFAAGWVLEQFAALIEHGWEVHAQNLWSFLDATFVLIYAAYGLVRIVEVWAVDGTSYALPVLCTAAPILLTRIAFTLMPDNIVFIALHSMMRDFTRLTFIAIWCFAGFVLGLLLLARTNGDSTLTNVTWATITKWLLWIWFGLDGTGLDVAPGFHLILGPILFITFAFLGNTLFLTILVAMLTNTFSKIISNEVAEVQFRRSVLTFQGVKSDAIFSYPPPFNLLALAILLPLKFIVSSRMFHEINVGAVRVINAPILLLIGLWERRSVWAKRSKSVGSSAWRYLAGFNPHGDIQAVFSAEPPPEIIDVLEKLDSLNDVSMAEQDMVIRSPRDPVGGVRRRKASNSSSVLYSSSGRGV